MVHKRRWALKLDGGNKNFIRSKPIFFLLFLIICTLILGGCADKNLTTNTDNQTNNTAIGGDVARNPLLHTGIQTEPSTNSLIVSTEIAMIDEGMPRGGTYNIGPQGGHIGFRDEHGIMYALLIPEDALLDTQSITINKIESISGAPLSGGFTAGIKLEPSGLQFAKPALLTITYPEGMQVPNGSAGTGFTGFAFEDDGRDFHFYPVQRTANEISFTIYHFSGYGAGHTSSVDRDIVRNSEPSSDSAKTFNELLDAEGKLDPNKVQSSIEINYETKVKPKLEQALANPDLFFDAFNTFMAWLRTAALLGIEDEITAMKEQGYDMLQEIMQKYYELAKTRCYENNDPSQALAFSTLARFAALTGLGSFDHWFDDLSNCLRFEVFVTVSFYSEFQSMQSSDVLVEGSGILEINERLELTGIITYQEPKKYSHNFILIHDDGHITNIPYTFEYYEEPDVSATITYNMNYKENSEGLQMVLSSAGYGFAKEKSINKWKEPGHFGMLDWLAAHQSQSGFNYRRITGFESGEGKLFAILEKDLTFVDDKLTSEDHIKVEIHHIPRKQ